MNQQGQRFRRRALRRGYKVDEVDEFLDRVDATLAGSPIGAPVGSRDVHDFVFRVRFGGYDEWQVDMHLDRVERQLAAIEEGGGLAPAEPARLPPGHDAYPPPLEAHPGPPQDEMGRAPRNDEPTMVRPARAAASVRGPEQAMPQQPTPGPARPTSGAAGGPVPGGRMPAPGQPRHPMQPGEDYTQKLPPVAEGGYEAGGEGAPPPSAAHHYERESGRYESEGSRYEAGRYDPEPSRHDSRRFAEGGRYEGGRYDEGGRFEQPGRYEPEPGRYEAEPSRYERDTGHYGADQQQFEPEPPRFEPHRPSYDAGYDARPAYGGEPRRYEPEPGHYEPATADPRGRPEPVDPRGGFEQQPVSGAGRFETGFEPGRHGKVDMTTEIPAADSPFTPDDLHHLDQMRRTFQVRRFGSGYDPAQVNRLFDAIAATMSGRATVKVSDGELDPGQFSLVQGGLFEAEVDGALRDVRDLFARRGLSR